MNKTSLLCIAFLTLICSANAAVLRINPNGSAPYATITDAYDAAASGDTIVIAPGTYLENIVSTKRLRVIGAGWDNTRIRNWYFQNASTGSSLEGVKVSTTGTVAPLVSYNSDSVTIKRCYLQSNYQTYFWARSSGSGNWITFEDCVMISNQNSGSNDGFNFNQDSCVIRNCYVQGWQGSSTNQNVFINDPAFLSVTNCVFTNWSQLLNTTGTYGFYFANNIVYDWNNGATFGTYSPTATFEYNASSVITPPGTDAALLTMNPFTNYDETANFQDDTTDLHLTPQSGLVDAGVPSLLDRDASRSDLGVYGGPYEFVDNGAPDYPFVISVVAPSAIISGDSLTINTIGRVGPRY
ncbi:MAG: hypothetical protein KDB65_10040 [Calditrichaeota bacterium]|nr:hypothetical protein [Calditrichota bacterium]MCB9369533.1 hypothetical protein [Calditrichota bacterium]